MYTQEETQQTLRSVAQRWYEKTYPLAYGKGLSTEYIFNAWVDQVVVPHFFKEDEVKEEVPNQKIGLAEQPEVSLPVSDLPTDGEMLSFDTGFTAGSNEAQNRLSLVINEDKKLIQSLLDALIESNLQIAYLHDKFQATGSGNSVMSRNESAITKANDFLKL